MSMLRRSPNGDGLLVLFEESGRNVERTGSLLRDLLDAYPERSSLARDILICEQEGDRITHDIIHSMTTVGSKLDQRDATTSRLRSSRSTASRTRATASHARRSPRCSRAGRIRWW